MNGINANGGTQSHWLSQAGTNSADQQTATAATAAVSPQLIIKRPSRCPGNRRSTKIPSGPNERPGRRSSRWGRGCPPLAQQRSRHRQRDQAAAPPNSNADRKPG